MHHRSSPVLLFLTLLSLCACSREEERVKFRPPGLPAAELRKYQACTQDADCVYAQNGCCDCVNGGTATAIHRAQVNAFQARFDCKDVLCTLVGAIPDCNEGKASCVGGYCEFERAGAE